MQTGNESTDLHELFKRKFLPFQTKTVLGQEIRLTSTTTELSKFDFSEYLEKICAFVQIPIPDPELCGYLPNDKSYISNKIKLDYPEEIVDVKF